MNYKKLSTLQKGTELKLSKHYKKFYNKEALSLCTTPSGKIDEEDYVLRKAVGMGIPYKLVFLEYCSSVGVEPGALVEFVFAPKVRFATLVDASSLSLKRGK